MIESCRSCSRIISQQFHSLIDWCVFGRVCLSKAISWRARVSHANYKYIKSSSNAPFKSRANSFFLNCASKMARIFVALFFPSLNFLWSSVRAGLIGSKIDFLLASLLHGLSIYVHLYIYTMHIYMQMHDSFLAALHKFFNGFNSR